MIIGIDGNEANVENKVGISEYAFELLQQFKKYQMPNVKFQIYLKDLPREDMPKEKEGWKYKIIKPKKLWTQLGLPFNLFLSSPRPDVFFTPTHYAPRFCPVPTAISIMDLSYIYFPQLFKKSDLYQLKNWTYYSVKKAKTVFTISKSSKNDIIKEYKIPENKVVVTYPGIKVSSIKNQVLSMDIIKEKYGIEGKYILFVGTLQPRKNITKLIEAFSKLKTDLKLVIIGKKGWLFEEILEAPEKFGVENRVKFLNFVPDEDLADFYSNAICFVLPSLYEGFGLPVVEAMKYGCPVITSNISSLPEAGGDAALYFDPQDADDIAAKIEQVISSEKIRKEMIEKGYNQVKKFSWKKTAEETLKELENIAGK